MAPWSVRLHDLRRSFASIGAAGNNSLLILGKLPGHRHAATTERYSHVSADPMQQAAEAIGQRISTALSRETATKSCRFHRRTRPHPKSLTSTCCSCNLCKSSKNPILGREEIAMSPVTSRHLWKVALTVVSTSMLLAPTFAKPNFPYHYHTEQNIDEHQVGSVDVTVNADGSSVVHTKFSNGKKVAGNTFSSATGFFGKDTKPFLVVVQTKGLDGSLLHNGKTQEGTEEQQVHLTPEQLGEFDHVQLISIRAMCDGIDFKCMSAEKVKAWLGPAIEIAKVIYGGWSP
jgi:hypothetical protein